jgi:hypothetical protein
VVGSTLDLVEMAGVFKGYLLLSRLHFWAPPSITSRWDRIVAVL